MDKLPPIDPVRSEAYAMGWKAWCDGFQETDNPYGSLIERELFGEWAQGHHDSAYNFASEHSVDEWGRPSHDKDGHPILYRVAQGAVALKGVGLLS